MEFVEGLLLPKWVATLKGRGTKKRIRAVLQQILEQCWKLDRAGLDHGELSRAPRHVIVDAEDRPRLVDFETASSERRTSNVTAICQFLFLGSQIAKTLRKRLGEIDDEALITSLRTYKSDRTEQSFFRILQVCRLTW
jgi:putative serine/threonine protein kinase